MVTDYLIRPETDGDRSAIAALLLEAFPTSSEARLVRQLRKDGDVVFSLVAVEDSEVIGHALYSRLHPTWRSPWRRSQSRQVAGAGGLPPR